jgi:KipI family sensor histidine kinase inhibitor
MSVPRLLLCGDTALSVDFGNVIDRDVNARVQVLDAALSAAPFPGVVETVPTYRALTVHFDPTGTDVDALSAHLLAVATGTETPVLTHQCWRVPVAYGGDHGVDLNEMAASSGLSVADFVEAHSASTYVVMMIGFMPGFSYLGGLDPRLARPRRDVPRAKVPASSVSIGGAQTAIGSVECPSGWHLIGRTPALPFEPKRDPIFLFETGDEIRFYPISEAEWRTLTSRAAEGELVAERIA